MSKTNKIIWLVVAVIVIALIIIFGGNTKTLTTKDGVIKIGVLADLSGDYANILKGGHRGVELAVEDLKADGKNVELIIEDQQSCNKSQTVSIVNKFINIDKVDFIIGGTCSSTTLVAAPIVEESKVAMISALSSAPSISNVGDYVFRTYVSDALRSEKAAEFAYEIGKRKMAIVYGNGNDAALQAFEETKKHFENFGGEVVFNEGFDDKSTDFKTLLTKIKSSNPDLLVIAITSPNQIGILINQMAELGVELPIISPVETPEDKQVIEIAGNRADGVIYIVPGNPPQSPAYQKLSADYKTKYGEEITQFTAEAYDATMLGVMAVLDSDGTREDIKDKLYEVSKTYQGVSGNVEFNENGDVSKDVIFKTIENGKFIEYK